MAKHKSKKRPVARPSPRKRTPPKTPRPPSERKNRRLQGASLASNMKGGSIGRNNRVGAAHIQDSVTRTVNRIVRKFGMKRGVKK